MAGKVKDKPKGNDLEESLATQENLVELKEYTEDEIKALRVYIDAALIAYDIKIKQHISEQATAVQDTTGQAVTDASIGLRIWCQDYVKGWIKKLGTSIKKYAETMNSDTKAHSDKQLTEKIHNLEATLDDKFVTEDAVRDLSMHAAAEFFDTILTASKQVIPLVQVKVAHTLYDNAGAPISGTELDLNASYSKMALKLRASEFVSDKQGLMALVSYEVRDKKKPKQRDNVSFPGQVTYDPVKNETKISIYTPDFKGAVDELNQKLDPDKQIQITDDTYLRLSNITVFGLEYKPGDFDKAAEKLVNDYRKEKAKEIAEKEDKTDTQGVK